MFSFLLRKFFRGILTLFLVVSFTFIILRVSGDPAEILLPDDTPPEVVAEYREALGLNAPLPVQFVKYYVALLQGEFGYSFRDETGTTVGRHENIHRHRGAGGPAHTE